MGRGDILRLSVTSSSQVTSYEGIGAGKVQDCRCWHRASRLQVQKWRQEYRSREQCFIQTPLNLVELF